jgi:hypothetical protein
MWRNNTDAKQANASSILDALESVSGSKVHFISISVQTRVSKLYNLRITNQNRSGTIAIYQ